MSKPPSFYLNFKKRFPDLVNAYERLGEECQSAGPLDERGRAIAKLAIAIGAGLEGAVHSHTRRARDAGLQQDEIRHVVFLSMTTMGFPSMMKALAWVEDVFTEETEA